MYCPKCKSELISGDMKEFETLSEHVCDPNKQNYPKRPTWVCSDVNCDTNKYGMFWNESGEIYSDKWVNDEFFIKNNSGPFGSFERRTNVEIYKKGVKNSQYLSPFLCLWVYKPYIVYNYKADEDGNVLKKSKKLKFLKYDKDTKSYCCIVSFLIPCLIRTIKHFVKDVKTFNRSSYQLKYMKEKFEMTPNRALYQKIAYKYKNIFYKKFKKSLYKIDVEKYESMIINKFSHRSFNIKNLDFLPEDQENKIKLLGILEKKGVIIKSDAKVYALYTNYELNKVLLRKVKLKKL